MELLTDKVIYHVETQEDYDDLMERLKKLGCKWMDYENPTRNNYWYIHQEHTCLYAKRIVITYSYKRFFEKYYSNTKIIKYKKEQNPMKVKLKADQKFIADWYEEHKNTFEFSVYCLLSDYRLLSSKEFIVKYGGKMLDWAGDSENKPVQILVKMHLFGYEIEREPLYYVELPNPNYESKVKKYYLARTADGRIVIQSGNTAEIKENWKLTEAEIKKDFAWAWDFAKEV